MTGGALAGVSALVAAGATIVVVITLGLISSRGRSWARWNHVSNVVLMLATIPPALAVALIQAGISQFAAGIALIGVVGMGGAATTEALLAVRRRTYEQLLPWTLGFGAVVGVWYLLVGVVGTGNLLRGSLDLVAILSGVGYVALSVGYWRGGGRHPLAALGLMLSTLGSALFLFGLGVVLVNEDAGIAWAI
jgi:hypothetical protein